MVQKLKKVYEGKTKVVYTTDSPDHLIHYFKDDTTAFNANKKGVIRGKGPINNKISTRIFQFLESQGIPTHFDRALGDREVLVKKAEMIPLELIIRNRAAGSLCRLLRFEEGRRFPSPILEYCYKHDELNDPIINESHILALGIATIEEIDTLQDYTFRINECLGRFFRNVNLELVDFKVEFGRRNGRIILADEISPDTARLWEITTGEKYDKDRFRWDMDHVTEAYQEVLSRVSQ